MPGTQPSDTASLPDSVDLVILGSGAGGLTAALTGAINGLRCMVLESQPVIGGTTARSSGTVWVPDNHHMRAAGITDDRARAETYLSALVGERGDPALWQAFLDLAPQMLRDLENRAGLRFRPFMAAPDYRQDQPGAAPGGRPLEPLEMDGRLLSDDFARLAWPLPELMLFGGMMITRAEAAQLLRADRSPRAAWLGLRLVARYLRDRLRHARGTRLVLGNGLVAQLLHALQGHGVPVLTGVTGARLLCDAGRVHGVRFTHAGQSVTLAARRGVVLAGGGFPASAEWRARHLPAPTPEHSPAAAGCDGSSIIAGLEAGATLGPDGQDNAQWFPSSLMTRADGSTAVYPHIILDRAKPGALAVNRQGRRFVNEAVSYHEFVRGMYFAKGGPHVPAFMICGRDFIRRYGLGLIRPRTPSLRRYVRNGYLAEAQSLDDLAAQLGLPADALAATVARFNDFAETGCDEDFKRGETIYERANGDPALGPNPCLGPLAGPPYYAVALWPTPLGTSRGLMADTRGRALDAGGAPIPGLYVCGNDMQSAFGGEYPGAGGQIGQAMAFAWAAAQHAAASERPATGGEPSNPNRETTSQDQG
ncbi:FAD-dependent oxidoreductase [Alkalilacustris brevis]|uniref:FAD-dependent oxidoreductase n=1 Tax=Alkalilacustris brevis TaxID=2026338 RepID=UPI000E0D047F|nr:FAD-dependent oxidoreductase [Alkalilacustris brevis]